MNELDQLEGLAAQADAGAVAMDPVDPNAPPVEAPADYATEAAGAVDMFAALVVGYCPKAESQWTDATKGRIAQALAPVLEKYGFTFGALPVELTLIIVAGPVLWQTSRLVASQMAEEKAAKPQTVEAKTTTGNSSKAAPTNTPEMPTSPQTALYP